MQQLSNRSHLLIMPPSKPGEDAGCLPLTDGFSLGGTFDLMAQDGSDCCQYSLPQISRRQQFVQEKKEAGLLQPGRAGLRAS